jgi:hypothetical protein
MKCYHCGNQFGLMSIFTEDEKMFFLFCSDDCFDSYDKNIGFEGYLQRKFIILDCEKMREEVRNG